MTTTQYKALLKSGLEEEAVETLKVLFESQENNLSKEDLHATELRLQKEIGNIKIEIATIKKETETIRKEATQNKAELQIEIEKIRREAIENKAELQKEIQETKAELQKEIQETKAELQKEIQQNKAELQIEIEKVRKEIAEAKNSITTRLLFFFSPIYIALIAYILKQFFFDK